MKYVLIAIIVIIVILAILYIAVKASQSAARRVERTVMKAKDSTSFMREMTAKAEILMKSAESDQAKQAAKEVYEAFIFSDPVSMDEISKIESDIKHAFDEFSEAVESNNSDSIKVKKESLTALVTERNASMKTLK